METTKSNHPIIQSPSFGYNYGMSQPATLLTFNVSRLDQVDFKAIDDWLINTFEIALVPCGASEQYQDGSCEKMIVELVWRILHLASSLLQGVNIPAFDAGRVLKVSATDQNASQFTVITAIPFIDCMPADVTKTAYWVALQVVVNAVKNQHSSEYLHTLLDEVDKSFIKPMSKKTPRGGSTLPLLTAVHDKKIPFRHLGDNCYQLGWGHKLKLIQLSTTETDSLIGAKLSNNKFVSANVIRAAGLPAPQHIMVSTTEEAIKAAETIGWPVVVKPFDLNRGEGITIDVSDKNTLLEAFSLALKLSKSTSVLVERQVAGVCHRLFVSHGKFLYAVKRQPQSVTGDGVHTVAELVILANAAENAKLPWKRAKLFPTDAMALENLARVGMTLDSLPQKGDFVPLRKIESTEWGGVSEDVTEIVHPDNVDIVTRVATLFGLNSAGVDLISSDISLPWHKNDAIINEINFSPYFAAKLSKKYRPIFIDNIIGDDGRIPVEVFVGGDAALEIARERLREITDKGSKCYLTSHEFTLLPSGEQLMLNTHGLFARTIALLMNRAVEAVLLVIQTDELLYSGLPVDCIHQITVVDNEIKAWNHTHNEVSETRYKELTQLLDEYRLRTQLKGETTNEYA